MILPNNNDNNAGTGADDVLDHLPQSLRMPRWDLYVAATARLENWQATGVFVPCWRLYWCEKSAAAWIRIKGKTIKLAPDRYTMIAPNTYIEAGLKEPMKHMWFHFGAGIPYDSITNWVTVVRLSKNETEDAFALAEALEQSPVPPLPHSVAAWINQAISRGMRCIPDELLHEQNIDARIQQALYIMRGNLSYTPASIAARINISQTTLNRIFNRHFGFPPGQVLALLRLERARTLLLQTSNTIDVIAEACGYCDRHHFSRCFSQVYGVGPALFRKRQT